MRNSINFRSLAPSQKGQNFQTWRFKGALPGVILLQLAPHDVPLVEKYCALHNGEFVLEAGDEALRLQERWRLQAEELYRVVNQLVDCHLLTENL